MRTCVFCVGGVVLLCYMLTRGPQLQVAPGVGEALRQLPTPECQMHASVHARAHAQIYSCSFHSCHLHARIRRRAFVPVCSCECCSA